MVKGVLYDMFHVVFIEKSREINSALLQPCSPVVSLKGPKPSHSVHPFAVHVPFFLFFFVVLDPGVLLRSWHVHHHPVNHVPFVLLDVACYIFKRGRRVAVQTCPEDIGEG